LGVTLFFVLPVILWTNSGLGFSSEQLHDKKVQHVIDINGQKLVRFNEVIFYADKFDTLTEDERKKWCFAFDARPI
jgi:F-type H+-transporting ATPase subunit a